MLVCASIFGKHGVVVLFLIRTVMNGLVLGDRLPAHLSATYPDTRGDCFLLLCLFGSKVGLSVL